MLPVWRPSARLFACHLSRPASRLAPRLSIPGRSASHRAQMRAWLAGPLALALLGQAQAHARQAADSAGMASAPAKGAANAPTANAPAQPVNFEADRVDYADADHGDIVTASGNVFLHRDHQSVRADTVTWNRKSGEIVASGNVRAVDEDGNETFTDHVVMSDDLKTGVMQDMLLLLREGGRLAATGGSRGADGKVRMDRAAYTACDVVDAKGCPQSPVWKVTARRVVIDADGKQFHMYGARLDLLGTVKIPLPGLTIATDGRAISGLMIPDIRSSANNGLSLSESYYQRLGDSRDIMVTGTVFTKVQPMGSVQFRQLTNAGAFQITGYATRSVVIPQSGIVTDGQEQTRGYVEGNGRFQLSPQWDLAFSGRLASDRTFLSRYDINWDDVLRSTIDVERVAPHSYFSIAGWAFQTLRPGQTEGQTPIALPEIDWRDTITDPWANGRITLQANSLAISRSAGQDTQRAFASAQWDVRRITALGQVVTFTGLLRGDVYHSSNNLLTSIATYQGQPGWQNRGMALAAVDITWPLIGEALGGVQQLTPHVQLVAVPQTRNIAIPNEDSRSVELEDDNLFALNRFPGYDRIEDGVRVTYGVDWRLDRPRWTVNATVGQSYRTTTNAVAFPTGTGLYDQVSDIVGRTELRYRDFITLTHRYRLDKDTLAFHRNEIDATIGSDSDYIELGYARLSGAIATALEDLQDSNELRAATRVAFARHWSLFGSGIFDLSNNNLGVGTTNKRLQPLRTRLGASFTSDCFELDVTGRRAYVTIGDAARGSSFLLHLAFHNIGRK